MKKILHILTALVLTASFAFAAACAPEDPDPGQPHTHDYTEWRYDEEGHWKVCPDDGEADPAGKSAHDFSGGNCVCGQKAPTPVSVRISGKDEVFSGKTVKLTASVSGDASDRTVKWSVVDGGDYISVDGTGLVTAKEVSVDRDATVRATSNADTSKYAEFGLTVVARTTLTQAMLDEAASHTTVEFSGTMNIDLYSLGLFPTLEEQTSVTVKTAMDGEYWYSEYEDSATGYVRDMYAKNVNGFVNEAYLSLMNEETYYPMTDSRGNRIPWAEGGLYNNFEGLKAEDFVFDEDTFEWVYQPKGTDDTLIERMVSSANPYEFDAKNLSLLILGDEIIGFRSESNPDYSLQSNYEARLTLTTTLNYENVTVPKVQKFEHEDFHDRLQTAIDKMKAHTSYTLDYTNDMYTYYAPEAAEMHYVETVTPDLVYYREDLVSNGVPYVSEYGYKKVGDGLVNEFYRTDGGETAEDAVYEASRAYHASIDEMKPGFNFSADIFYHSQSTGEGTTDYYVHPSMVNVAREFYFGVGTDEALYGLYAAALSTEPGTILPFVTVDDETNEIVGTGFGYDMGMIIRGVVFINYSDYDTASVDTPVEFKLREVPASWDGFIRHIAGESAEDRQPLTELFTETFGEGVEVPFFGAALGDTYGFVTDDVYRPKTESGSSSPRMYECLAFFYDVPLDEDYTITSSMDAVGQYLVNECGFTETVEYQYTNGTLGVSVTDRDQDFYIYVWKWIQG